ncbi:MAG: macrocin-O-methyltransferase domain protein [Gammaproteobacteria bacterium]|nr:macrocin-O-methyltransferase domain protein [Gammaproteobacteria bacterium]
MKVIAKRLIHHLGFDICVQPLYPSDLDQESVDIIRRVKPYTMTSTERLFSLIQAVRYVLKTNIPGDIVECGVWRGGSMMAVAYTLKQLEVCDRDLYLFDTFEGMTRPTNDDIDFQDQPASKRFERSQRSNNSSEWCHVSIEDVQRNLFTTEYSKERIKFIKGRVEDTIPDSAPDRISILRLDTDWFESTRHELTHLYPRLSKGGVLIIDDYGHWQGCRKATDEYFAQHNISILLNRIDYTGRIAVKS